MFTNMNIDSVKATFLLMALFIPSTMLHAEEAVLTSSSVATATEQASKPVQQTTYVFPGWPERPQAQREIIPPPPPGPYMSLALSNFANISPAFDKQRSKKNDETDASVVMDAFSPDRPWPKILRPVKRWMPEDGYRYVDSQVSQQAYSAAQNRPSANYNYGYRRAPYYNPPGYMPAYNYPGAQSGYRPYQAPYAAVNKP